MASEHGQGEQAFAGIFLVCVTVGLSWTYRAVTIPLAVAVIVLLVWRWVNERRRRATERTAIITAVRAEMADLCQARGAKYLQLFAEALRYLATGRGPTFVGFEQDLGMSRSVAKSVMADLEERGYVTPPLHGRRRSVALDSAALTESADIADDIAASR